MSAGLRELLVEGKKHPSEFCASFKGRCTMCATLMPRKDKEKRHKIPKVQARRAIISIKTLKTS